MRSFLILFLLQFISLTDYAQTIYYDSLWKTIPTKEGAFYYRETENRNDTFYVKDYYISGQVQMTGSFLDKKCKTKNGHFTYYHSNGQKSSEGTYTQNKEQQGWKYWSDTGEELEYTETMPEYLGGKDALMAYLSENIKYPKDAINKKKHGRAIIQFVVGTDGSIGQVEVIKSVYPSIDEEAVRVVSSMPKWKPGTQYGKPISVKYRLPVVFKLR